MLDERIKETASSVLSLLGKTYVSFVLSLIFAAVAFALACIAAAFARREVAEITFLIAFWLAFAVLCLKQPWPEKIEVNAPELRLAEYILPCIVGVGLAAWVIIRYALPFGIKLAAAWGLF